MALFNRKPKFLSAKCPECNGNLILDSNMETATCSKCGNQCIVQNLQKNRNKNSLDKVIGFVERQQNLKRKDKLEKAKNDDSAVDKIINFVEKQQAKKNEKEKKANKNATIIASIAGIILAIIIITMILLKHLGVV